MTKAQKQRIDNVERYHALKAAGLCVDCKGEPEAEKVRCRRCLLLSARRSPEARDRDRERKRIYQSKTRNKRRSEGSCPRCGKGHHGLRVSCRRCLRAQAAWDSRRKDAGRESPREQRRCSWCHVLGHNRTSCEVREREEAAARVYEAAGARRAA